MKKIVINKSYEQFFVSHKAFIRLRELGQVEALQETDRGAYWPLAATTGTEFESMWRARPTQ